MELAPETPEDWWEVEALFDLCFAPGREALSSYRLRDGVPPVAELCHVARDETGAVAGAIRYWPIRIGEHEALLLGPVAVHPTHQGEGLGAFLIQETLEHARALGAARVLLIGDAPYYGRFGFQICRAVSVPPPTNPDRILSLALTPGGWTGVSGAAKPAISV